MSPQGRGVRRAFDCSIGTLHFGPKSRVLMFPSRVGCCPEVGGITVLLRHRGEFLFDFDYSLGIFFANPGT